MIWDCRRKEKLITKRVGGDFEIRLVDCNGQINICWFEMKPPYKTHFKKLEALMEDFKCQMKRQES